MNEAQFKTKLKKLLPKGTWHYCPVQSGMGANGIPDIICCVPTVITEGDVGKTFGMFLGLEAKIYPNKTTDLQDHQLEGIAEAAGRAVVATGYKDPKKAYTYKEILK